MPSDRVQVNISARRDQRPGNLPWLSVQGSRMVDATGRTVVLRGFNTDALLEYGDGMAHETFRESDAELISRSGFNVVRIGVSWSRLESVRGKVDAAYLDRIGSLVETLNRHGLYAVLDMHFSPAFGPRFGGAGAPKWAYVPGLPGFEQSSNYWLSKVLSPDALTAYSYFYLSPDWQADYELVWQAVAQRFREQPGVAAYDLINEPHPLPIPPLLFEKYWLWPFYARIIDAIGKVDGNHIFVLDNTMLSNIPTAITPVKGAGIVYGPHVYYGVFAWPLFDGTGDGLRQYIERLRSEAAQLGAPMWVGETGIDRRDSSAAKWTQSSLDAYDQLGVGWAWWQWGEDSGWGIRNARGQVDWKVLRLIARPFLIAAPQGITSRHPSSAPDLLEIDISPKHGPGDVEVAWGADLLGVPKVQSDCAIKTGWEASKARLLIDPTDGQACKVKLAA